MSWAEIARQIDISKMTISNHMQSHSRMSAESMQKLLDFFESRSIEFIDNGVRERKKGVATYEGRDGFASFRQDVLAAARVGNADICISDVDDRLFDKWGQGEVNEKYRKEMMKLTHNTCRVLVREKDFHFPASDFAEYRWSEEGEFGDFSFYLYANKTAMLIFDDNNLYIYVIEDPNVTTHFRKQFNAKWDSAHIPT